MMRLVFKSSAENSADGSASGCARKLSGTAALTLFARSRIFGARWVTNAAAESASFQVSAL